MTSSEPSFKASLRPYIPAFARRVKRALFGWRWFRGRYATWAEAQTHAVGYDEPGILDRVLKATLEVKAGRAAYERDSVLFTEPAVEPELLACLEQVAAASGNRLRVLDFGGSLGSTYWQHRSRLAGLMELRWDVVEQTHFVKTGRQYLQDDTLRFFPTIDEAEQACTHEVLLVSGVLHCLPAPHEFLADFVARAFPHLLLHNLPLHPTGPDYVMVEHVPAEIYPATYPVWFLNRADFMGHFPGKYDVVQEYASTAVWDRGWADYPSTGLFLKLKAGPT